MTQRLDANVSSTIAPSSSPSKCSLARAMDKPTVSSFDVSGSILKAETRNQGLQCNDVPQVTENNKKSVKFGGLIIREHKLTIGDLPWRDGPPVALSWEQVRLRHMDLEEFELAREGERRLQKDLHTSAADRIGMLKEQGGYSDQDLLLAKRRLNAVSLSSRPLTTRHRRSISR